MSYLHITLGTGKKSVFLLNKNETTLGRKEDNDIVLSEGPVSRLHAKILKKGNEYYLGDQGSFNGTRVNGELIQEARLQVGDEIQIGKTRLVFTLSKEPIKASGSQTSARFPDNEASWRQQMVSSVPGLKGCQESSSLLVTLAPHQRQAQKKGAAPQAQAEIDTLERTNKVLYVLFEVSRQLNSLQEFEQLLDTIMDLILKVIEADFGFLFLLGEKDLEDLYPVVVKTKDRSTGDAASMMASRTMIKKVLNEGVALLTSDAMDDSRFASAESIITKKIHSAMCVPLWDRDKIIGIIQLTSSRPGHTYTENDVELLGTIGCQMAMVIGQARLNKHIKEEEEIRKRLERFHSPQVIDMILKGGKTQQEDIMDPKEVTATVLFTDIAGFTPLAETMPPREVTLMLNRYFSRMTDIIFEFGGTLDKYLGDGMMAVFGAPVENEDDAERAVRAALKIREEFLRIRGTDEQSTPFDIRLGINTGTVVAGNIGSPRRMDYTVIGDPVNIASRLEAVAQANQILISENTYTLVKNRFKLSKIGEKELKGKSKAIMTYEVIGEK
jgi:adenylate cyclase